MNKQEYKILSGLVRANKIRASEAFPGFDNLIAVGHYYNDWPPSLPSRVLAAYIHASKFKYTAAAKGLIPRPVTPDALSIRLIWTEVSDYRQSGFSWRFHNV